ncbi:Endoplasmic reticulum oxidoreductin-2 [Glycine max]|nr:Endoplasmic reticulum oxidoreductin-2 [Glycine max]KAH1215131.1 Endoplasmic reticulum oxidoreductin-2 [Glycine max]
MKLQICMQHFFVTLMYDRVLRYPDRVRNLYFTFLFVLRAVTKVLGLGTALKILFSIDGKINSSHTLQLQRNKVIALTNLLNRLLESIKFSHKVGPTAERNIEGRHFSAHTRTLISSWKKIWSYVSKT